MDDTLSKSRTLSRPVANRSGGIDTRLHPILFSLKKKMEHVKKVVEAINVYKDFAGTHTPGVLAPYMKYFNLYKLLFGGRHPHPVLQDQAKISIPTQDSGTITQHPGILTPHLANFGIHAEHVLLQFAWYLAMAWLFYFIFLRQKPRARPIARGVKKSQ